MENPKHPNWGWYRVLDDKIKYKVKELVIIDNHYRPKHYFRS